MTGRSTSQDLARWWERKRGEGPLGSCFDRIEVDPLCGCNTWEEAESRLQTEAARLAVKKAGLSMKEIRVIYAGDLLRSAGV